MNSTCWASGSWIANSWIDGSWCPITPVPVVTPKVEDRKWPGPPIILYREPETDLRWLAKLKREDEEVFIL